VAYDPHANLAITTVAVAPSPALSGTSLTLTADAGGALFPAPGAQGYNVTVWATGTQPIPTNAEIVRVTGKVGNVLTIVRTQEGTSARAIVVGDLIAVTITAKVVTDVEAAITANTNFAGTNGAITGGSITVNTSGVSVNLPAYLTTAALSNHSHGNPTLNLTNLSGTTASNSAGLTLSLSAAAQSAQTGISGIAGSNTTYSSGTVQFTGVGGGVTVSSNTGQRIDISVAAPVAQTVQTQNLIAASLSGNTAGVLALVSSGTAIFAGGNNITLSQNGQSITISGANAGGAQTAISGVVVSNTTYTSGTISFSNAGNITISSSVNGATQYVVLSGHASQTNQSAIKGFGVSNTGQTAGNTGISSGIDWVLAGSGSITLSQSTAGGGPNTVWMQHPAWITTATQSSMTVSDAATSGTLARLAFTNLNGVTLSLSTGAAGSHTIVGSHNAITSQSTQFLALTLGGNTAGTTTFHATNNASLFFNGGNNVTLSGNGSTVTISAANQTVQTQNLIAASLSGNTAGVLALVSSGTMIFAGGNNITLSQNGQSVTISGANAGGAQTAISGIVVSDTTYTSGTVSFSNQANVTIGSSANGATQYIRLSVAPVTNSSLTMQAGASTLSSVSRVAFVDSNGVSFGASTSNNGSISITATVKTDYLTTQSTQFLALTLGGNTAGTTTFHATNNASLFFNGGNNITLSGNGSTVTISAANQTNQSAIKAFGVSNTGQTAGNTGVSTGIDWVLAGSQSITLSQSTAVGGPNTVWMQHPAWLTTAMASNRGSDFVAATAAFAGTNASGTIASDGISVSVAAPGAAAENNWINLLGANTAGNTSASGSTIGWSGGNGVTLSGTNNSQVVISVNTYSTVGTATTAYSVASANSVGTVTRWAAEDHAHAGVGAIGISTSGNTAGTTGSVLGTYWFQGGNNITVSQITSNNGSHTLVLSGAAGGGSPQSYYLNIDNYAGMVTGASAITQTSGSSIFVQPFIIRNDMSASYLRLLASFNDSAVGTAGTPVVNSTFSVERYTTIGVVLYSQGTGASSRSLQYVTSSSAGLTGQTVCGAGAQSSRYTVTVAKTYPATGATNNNYTSSYAVSSASIVVSSNSNTLFTGPRFLDIPWARSFSAGNYWFGIGASTSSTSNSGNISFAGTAAMPVSIHGISQIALSMGLLGAVTSASDHQMQLAQGVWTTNSSIWSTSSIAISQVSQVVSNPQLPFQLIRQA